MNIKKLSIRQLGGIEDFGCDFCDGLSILTHRETATLSYAIGILLNSKAFSSPFGSYGIRKESSVSATVSIRNEIFYVSATPNEQATHLVLRAKNAKGEDVTSDYLYRSLHCAEHDCSDVFDGHGELCLLHGLVCRNQDFFEVPETIYERTDGMFRLKAFRSYLSSFTKNFRSQTLRPGKPYTLILKRNGAYEVQGAHKERSVSLSQSEQKLFSYLCFLNTAEFWKGFEEMRNINDIKKPLLVKDLLERLDESIDLDDILRRTANLKRQVILLTSRPMNL